MKWVKVCFFTVGLVVALFLSINNQMSSLKSVVFILLLLQAAITDIKTRTIPDYIPIMIILIGVIGMEPMSSLLGLLFVPLPYFIMALIRENSMGGGDIKLMGACSFYLGLRAGYLGSIIGLLLAIVIHSSYGAIINKSIDKSIPLAPYLGTGCLIAQIIFSF